MNHKGPESGANPVLFWKTPREYFPLSIEEISANEMNRWQGWECLAGQNHIHISFEGDIYRGTCQVGGKYGNIFSDPVFPESSIICTKRKCVCGAEMVIPKYRSTQGHRQKLRLETKTDELPASPIAVTGYKNRVPEISAKTVMWNLGRRCNYSCSYCSPDFHSKTEKLRTAEEFKKGVSNVLDGLAHEGRLSFFFSGGEPTLYPGFNEVVHNLVQQGHAVSISTNGSRKASVYLDLIDSASLSVSAHLEFYKQADFIENLRRLVLKVLKSRITSKPIYSWIDIKVMTPPGKIGAAKELAEKLAKIPYFHHFAAINFQILWVPDRVNEFYSYNQEELDFFSEYNKAASPLHVERSILQKLNGECLHSAIYMAIYRSQKRWEKFKIDFLIRNWVRFQTTPVMRLFFLLHYYIKNPKAIKSRFFNVWIPMRNWLRNKLSWTQSIQLMMKTAYRERDTHFKKWRYILAKPYWYFYGKLHFVRVAIAYFKKRLPGGGPPTEKSS